VRLGGSNHDVRAVAVTGYAGDQDRARAIAAGNVEHLAKPIETRHLIIQIAAALL
jgi:CheY-like chemotaxis protein